MRIKVLISYLPNLILSSILLFSLFYFKGSKFDNANTIIFILGFCFSVIAFFIYKLKDFIYQRFTFLDLLKTVFLIAYVAWMALSFFKSQTANFGFTEVLMTCGAILLFLMPNDIFKWKWIYRFNNFLLLFTSIAGYFLYLTSHHSRGFGLFYNPAFKTDAWPNAFALFVLLLWPFFFHAFLKAKRFTYFYIISLGFIFASFILTFSRAGFIAFSGQIFLLVLFFIYSKKILAKKFLQIVIIGVLTFILISGGQYLRSAYFKQNILNFNEKVVFDNGESVSSVQERNGFFKGSLDLIKQEPLFGFGPMSFGFVYRSIQQDWLAVSDHPHNMFLKTAVESGVPAAIFLLLFLIILLIKVLRAFPNLEEEKKLLLAIAVISILGAIAHNQVDFNLNFATNFILFWVILKLIDSLASPPIRQKKWRLNFVHFVIILFFLITTFFTFREIYYKKMAIQTGEAAFYENSYYPRYFLLDSVKTEDDFNKYLVKNPWDATAYTRFGQFYRDKKDYEKALTFFGKALELDPKNNWIYYLNYLQTLQKLARINEILNLSEKVEIEIEQYLPKVKANMHFTAQHGNSQDAIEVLKILVKFDNGRARLFRDYINVIAESREKYSK